MVSVCTVPARGGRSCEHFGGYKTINRIPLPLLVHHTSKQYKFTKEIVGVLSVKGLPYVNIGVVVNHIGMYAQKACLHVHMFGQ